MSVKSNVPVGAFLAEQGNTNLGQFTGLALGPDIDAAAQGQNLAINARIPPAPPPAVTTVTATAPITSSGGFTPNIAIVAASNASSGSMSQLDKIKLDAIPLDEIIWRPGVPTADGHVATWAEVEVAIALRMGDLVVIIDDMFASAIIPSTADTDCLGGVTLASFELSANPTIRIADGGRLKNLATMREIVVIAAPTVRSPLYYDRPNMVLQLVGTTLFEDVGTTKALIEVDVAALIVYAVGQTFLDNTTVPANPIVDVNPGNLFGLTVVAANFATLSPNAIQGDATTTFLFQHDLSIEFVAQALMAGSVTESRLSFAAAAQPSEGATGARPTIPFAGQMYFDSGLGIPIWWNGAAWVNATGLPV